MFFRAQPNWENSEVAADNQPNSETEHAEEPQRQDKEDADATNHANQEATHDCPAVASR